MLNIRLLSRCAPASTAASPQFAANLLHINGLTFVREGRIPGDDEQPADTRQRSDNLLDHPIGEVFLLGVSAHIGERPARSTSRLPLRDRWRKPPATEPEAASQVLHPVIAPQVQYFALGYEEDRKLLIDY